MMATPIPPFTAIEPCKFESITPLQFLTFTMPNALNHRLRHRPLLRVTVCDSPLANADDESPVIAAMIVPKNRETDWNFCTESAHMQLLFKFRSVSRLILIGNIPPNRAPSIYKRPSVTDTTKQERLLKPLLMRLHPKQSSTSDNGFPETLFLANEDDVAYRVTVATYLSPIVGDFLVEDVELVGNTDRNKQLRRRLRFKRNPRVVQSQALLVPVIPYDEATTQTDLESLRKIEGAKFQSDTRVLVHDYLIAMVSCLSLIASHLTKFFYPKALCLGVGGGVLLNFLETVMEFKVTGVEADNMVVSASRFHFGLNKSGSIRLIVGDAIETIQNFPHQKPKGDTVVPDFDKFDVVFVDLDSSDARNGFSAPPPEFVQKPVFESLRSLLDDHGGLIINVVRLDEVFYETLVKELKENFHKVYEINVGNEENYVVMATVSPPSYDDIEYLFLNKLKSVIPGTYMNSMVEL